MTKHSTPPCCEAWESWADSANWFVDTDGNYRMPHLKGTPHRFNFCPSCGSERRSAIVVAAQAHSTDKLAAVLAPIADHIEKRGAQGLDLDPG